jgi:hypothetical protein
MVGKAIATNVPKIINAFTLGFKLVNKMKMIPKPKDINANGNNQTPNKLMRNARLFNPEPIAEKAVEYLLYFIGFYFLRPVP